MSLHSSLFFKNPYPRGFGIGVTPHGNPNTPITEITDNDYTTFSTFTDIDINVADDTDAPTRITHIFLKAKNVTDWGFTPTGGAGTGVSNRNIPATVQNYEGTPTKTTCCGFQHDLYALPQPITATQLRMHFRGTGLHIYQVLCLDVAWEINANQQYQGINFNKVDRSGQLVRYPFGQLRRIQNVKNSRLKWNANYRAIFREHNADAFLQWLEDNPNFAFAQEFSRYPARVYLACDASPRIQVGYLTNVTSQGRYVQFQIAER